MLNSCLRFESKYRRRERHLMESLPYGVQLANTPVIARPSCQADESLKTV
jgi:hypothetical protein